MTAAPTTISVEQIVQQVSISAAGAPGPQGVAGADGADGATGPSGLDPGVADGVYTNATLTVEGGVITDIDSGEGGGGGTGLPAGGTSGQLLRKQSATDGDADWENWPLVGIANGTYAFPILTVSGLRITAIGQSTDVASETTQQEILVSLGNVETALDGIVTGGVTGGLWDPA